MKVLVTGANGFLGVALVERLICHGVQNIRCIVREGSARGRLDAVREKYPNATIEYYFGTLVDTEDCEKAVKGVTRIFHLAGTFSGAIADMFYNTVVGTKKLFDAAIAENPRMEIIFISSFSVYGVSQLPAGTTISEITPLEEHPEKRDPYAFVKSFQEKLVVGYQQQWHFPLVIIRPGVIYGPGAGSAMSGRVGIRIGGIFLHLGGSNLLPLSYVDNCADAIVLAGERIGPSIEVYNVHDNELPTSREYLKAYRSRVEKLKVVSLPYFLLQMISRLVAWYHAYSKGQLPDIFTPYKTAAIWKGNRFDNSKLRKIGWKPLVSTAEGMERAFAAAKRNK
jgi:nucleoside-diphosphate-sugar epimerase